MTKADLIARLEKDGGSRELLAVAVASIFALSGCGESKTVTVCNWHHDREIYVGGDINISAVRDEYDGCRYIKNGNRGNIVHDGQPCWGPRKCETISREQWEAKQALRALEDGK